MSGPPEVTNDTKEIIPVMEVIIQQQPTIDSFCSDSFTTMDFTYEYFKQWSCNISDFFNYLSNAVELFLYNVSVFIYKSIYLFIEYWFLHGPRWWWLYVFKGNGGIPEKDICANFIGTNSDSFEGSGSIVCKEYIHHIINERTLFVSVLLVCCYIKYGMAPTWNFFHSLYNHEDFLDKKKKRELANEKSLRTRKCNEEIKSSFRAMCAILHNDDIFFASQINSLRNVLNNINNDDVVDLINWSSVKGTQWESSKIPKNKQLVGYIGDGS